MMSHPQEQSFPITQTDPRLCPLCTTVWFILLIIFTVIFLAVFLFEFLVSSINYELPKHGDRLIFPLNFTAQCLTYHNHSTNVC